MSLGRENEPTLAVPKSVGWVLTWGWIARSFVAMFEALLSGELEAKGALQQENLSESIEGLQDSCFGVIGTKLSQKGPFSFSACLERLWKLRDPQERTEMAYQLGKRVSTRDLSEMEAQLRRREFASVDARWNQILGRAGVKTKVHVRQWLSTLWAMQVAFRCLVAYKTNPLLLIAEARRGDRRAVLDLIKIDRAFLTDPCTERAIREAALESDRSFTEQLSRAIAYRAQFTTRDAIQLYLFTLFIFGVGLPRIYKLQQTLDPEGTEFPTVSAFERFLQRSRQSIAFEPVEG